MNHGLLISPWCYDGVTPLIDDIQFTLTQFWVQIHNLPILNLSYKTAEEIGVVAIRIANGTVDSKLFVNQQQFGP